VAAVIDQVLRNVYAAPVLDAKWKSPGKIELQHPGGPSARIDEVSGLQIAKIVIIFLFGVVFYFGIAGLKSGEIRSRGYKFHRDEDPIGYWFTILVSLGGPVAIIYVLLTR